MSENNPHQSDAVLGNQNLPPSDGGILGGLAGVKQGLASESIGQRLQALNNSVKYGTDAIDLACEALIDDAEEVRRLARKILRDRLGEAGREALLNREPTSCFVDFSDWREELYDDYEEISDPENTAYIIEINTQRSWRDLSLSNLREFTPISKDPRVGELEALILKINNVDTHTEDEFKYLVASFRAFVCIHKLFKNLKSLQLIKEQIEDEDNRHKLDKKDYPHLPVIDLQPLLTLFPNLEYLDVDENFCRLFTHANSVEKYFQIDGSIKNKLRTLIIKNISTEIVVSTLRPVKMPKLEYFEFWFNDFDCKDITPTVTAIGAILSKKSAPNLKYLSLCTCRTADRLIKALMRISFVEQIAILDFKMGGMTDVGVRHILDCPNLGNLKFLNVSSNLISDWGIEQLQKLPFKVEAANQNSYVEQRDLVIKRYERSYE
jgi:Leucine-rich repeat (LRR) protein